MSEEVQMDLLAMAARVSVAADDLSVPDGGGGAVSKLYRIIGDEPVGVAVGFEPSKEALDACGVDLDGSWTLVEDDGSSGTPFLKDPAQNDVVIRDVDPADGIEQGMSPLGMDLAVWRSEEEMLADLVPEDGY